MIEVTDVYTVAVLSTIQKMYASIKFKLNKVYGELNNIGTKNEYLKRLIFFFSIFEKKLGLQQHFPLVKTSEC